MTRKRNPYTPEERAIVGRMWQEGATMAAIVTALGGTHDRVSIYSTARRMRLPRPGLLVKHTMNGALAVERAKVASAVREPDGERVVPPIRLAYVGFQHRRFDWEVA